MNSIQTIFHKLYPENFPSSATDLPTLKAGEMGLMKREYVRGEKMSYSDFFSRLKSKFDNNYTVRTIRDVRNNLKKVGLNFAFDLFLNPTNLIIREDDIKKTVSEVYIEPLIDFLALAESIGFEEVKKRLSILFKNQQIDENSLSDVLDNLGASIEAVSKKREFLEKKVFEITNQIRLSKTEKEKESLEDQLNVLLRHLRSLSLKGISFEEVIRNMLRQFRNNFRKSEM